MLDLLNERFELRYQNIINRAKKFGKTPPNKDQLWDLLKTKYLSNFTCEYCGVLLKVKDEKKPYLRSFSFDHKKSLFTGGTNDITNFAIVCTQCNIIKGTMDTPTFKLIIKYLPRDIQIKMFYANYGSRLANKLSREKSLTLESKLWEISKQYEEETYLPPVSSCCLKPLSAIIGSENQICLKCKKEFKVVEKN